MPLRPLDVLMGLAVPLVWGMGVVFSKAAIEHFPPILLMALRFTLTALILVWFVKPPWRVMGQLVAIAFISAAIQYSLTFNGLRGVDASTAVLVLQIEPRRAQPRRQVPSDDRPSQRPLRGKQGGHPRQRVDDVVQPRSPA